MMDRIQLLCKLSSSFEYKTVSDIEGSEFVFLRSSAISFIDFQVADKTAFEAVENHVHIIDRIKRKEIPELVKASNIIGQSVLKNLKSCYPERDFVIYISISPDDSMIIRFHQKWHSEMQYYDLNAFNNTKDVVLMFES